jgi:hypothetical protein
MSISWESADTDGLSHIYKLQANTPGGYEGYWNPTTVGSYPAVYADIADDRSSGHCSLNVAVSDTLFFIAQAQYTDNPSQACLMAAKAAADVVKNLGGS